MVKIGLAIERQVFFFFWCPIKHTLSSNSKVSGRNLIAKLPSFFGSHFLKGFWIRSPVSFIIVKEVWRRTLLLVKRWLGWWGTRLWSIGGRHVVRDRFHFDWLNVYLFSDGRHWYNIAWNNRIHGGCWCSSVGGKNIFAICLHEIRENVDVIEHGQIRLPSCLIIHQTEYQWGETWGRVRQLGIARSDTRVLVVLTVKPLHCICIQFIKASHIERQEKKVERKKERGVERWVWKGVPVILTKSASKSSPEVALTRTRTEKSDWLVGYKSTRCLRISPSQFIWLIHLLKRLLETHLPFYHTVLSKFGE